MVQAQGALRDLRYFLSTNNLRLVKFFLQMRIKDVLLIIYKIENHPIYVIFSCLLHINTRQIACGCVAACVAEDTFLCVYVYIYVHVLNICIDMVYRGY